VSYEEPKTRDYGVNLCEGCLDKQREIDRLKEENLRLKQKLSQNLRKAKAGFFGSSTPSSQVPVKANSLSKKQAKQGGGQIGHLGHGRKTFTAPEADECRIAEVSSSICDNCECDLHRQSANQRTVYELERERVRKVFYTIERKVCPVCRKTVGGKVRNAFARVSLSNDLVIEIAEQYFLLGRSLGQITERFSLSESTIFESLKRIGVKLKPSLANLRRIYRQSQVRHADETGWRTNGSSGYAWYFGSKDVSLYLFRQTRSASVVEETFGKEQLRGVLVVDQYGGYNRVPCEIQYCYAHLLRKKEDLAKEFPKSREIKTYTSQMIKWLSEAMKLRTTDLNKEKYQAEAEKIKQKILKLSNRQAKHPAVRRWQDFYVEKADRLYQWCESAEIPAENNYAEREVRKIVIARKISYGSQSEEGAETREIWTSVLASLKKREANPREKLLEGLNKLSEDENFDIGEFLFGTTKSSSD
jgi:transposase